MALVILYACQPQDKQATALRLMKGYLDGYKSTSVDEGHRLSDFSIDEIRILKFDGQVFMCAVVFSVKPIDVENSDWIAGNGELGEGGWIVHKYTEVAIFKEGNEHVMKRLGLG